MAPGAKRVKNVSGLDDICGMQLSANVFKRLVESLVPPKVGDRDRRRVTRMPVEASVFLRPCEGEGAAGEEPGDPIRVSVRDVSLEGICVVHNRPLPSGRQFWIHLPNKAGEPLAIRCTVRNCFATPDQLYRIGAEFESVAA